jgi:hypothetical protein
MRSGIGIAGLRSLELISASDFDKVRILAPHLRLTEEQAVAMFTIQRKEMLKRCMAEAQGNTAS